MKKALRKRIYQLLVFCSFSSYSQSVADLYKDVPNTPNVSSLFKVKDFDVNESTGNANISIPLYTINLQSDEVSIPMTLNYDSRGIKVEGQSGCVGTSWTLKAFGVINRKLNGLPDETTQQIDFWRAYDSSTGNPVNCTVAKIKNGLGWLENSAAIMAASDYSLANNGSMQNYSGPNYNSALTGFTAPDVFSYFLPNGVYGSFVLKNQYTAISSSNHKVDFTIDSNQLISKFTITDELGNKYYFETVEQRFNDLWLATGCNGGEFSHNPKIPAAHKPLENYDALWNAGICWEGSNYGYNSQPGWQPIFNKPINMSWFLSKIVTSKNNVITFYYEDEVHTFLTPTKILYEDENPYNNFSFSNSNKFEYFKTKRIKQIISPDTKVKFNYQTDRREDVSSQFLSTSSSSFNKLSEMRALKNIEVNDIKDKNVKVIDFQTSYKTAIGFETASAEKKYLYKRLWLDKITINNLESYEFIYNQDKLPYRFSYEQDYWGYFNNNLADSSGKSLFPDLWYYPTDPKTYTRPTQFSIFKRTSFSGIEKKLSQLTTEYPTTLINVLSNRNVNEASLKAGVLEKIIYPTKGYQKFEYESNDFTFENELKKGFGLRIKKSELYDYNDVLSSRTEYEYKKANGSSSGCVTDMPAFAKIFTKNTDTGQLHYAVSTESFSSNYNLFYSEVKRKIKEKGSITTEFFIPYTMETDNSLLFNSNFLYQKKFNLYKQKIACKSMGRCTQTVNGNIIVTLPDNTYEYPLYSFNDNYQDLFGKKIKEKVLDEAGNDVVITENEYSLSNMSNKVNYYTKGADIGNYYVKSIGFSGLLLKKVKTTNYYSGVQNITESEYQYNAKDLLAEEKSTDSNGDINITKYDYCTSDLFKFEFNFTDMRTLNMLNYPIVVSNLKNGNLVSKVFNKYYSNNSGPFGITNFIYLSEIFKLDIDKPINDFVEFNWTDPQQPNFGMMDSRMKSKVKFHKYETNGNLIDFSKTDDSHKVLIWGYNKTKIIAEIENIDYASIPLATIQNLQALSDADDDTCDSRIDCNEQSLRLALDQLRLSLPNAIVKTYTHDPLVGVTSMTDARGNTTYYSYDSFQRLKKVRDKDGKVLSENEYNYKNN